MRPVWENSVSNWLLCIFKYNSLFSYALHKYNILNDDFMLSVFLISFPFLSPGLSESEDLEYIWIKVQTVCVISKKAVILTQDRLLFQSHRLILDR